MKKIVLLSVVIMGLGAGAAHAQCWGNRYNPRPNVGISVGTGWNGGVQWGVSVGNGIPVGYPGYNVVYPTAYPVYQAPVCPPPVQYNCYPNTYYRPYYYSNGYYNRRNGWGWGRNRCR